MAIADVTTTIANESYVVELLANASATNGIPSSSTAGIETNALIVDGKRTDKIRVGIQSTAGSGTMTVTLRVWLYAGAKWYVAKALAASTAAPQTAVAIAETGADTIQYSEEVSGLIGASRIYLEIVALAGTTPAFTGYAIVGF